MGIKFDSIAPASTAPAPALVAGEAVSVPSVTGGFTLDLSKGAVLDLVKEEPGLKRAILGAGWDASTNGVSIDLDIAALLLRDDGKITGTNDVIYFNHMEISGIKLNKDDRTGSSSDGGDDETIDIEFDKIPAEYKSIVFVVSIYDGTKNKQTFGMVNNSYVRLVNSDTGEEICHTCLKGDYSSSTAVIFARLNRGANGWQFEAILEGKVVQDLNGIAALYM